MRSSTLLAFLAAAIVGFSFAGCNCGDNGGGGGDAGSDGGGGGDAGSDAGADAGPTCFDNGAACTGDVTGTPCCSGVCQGGTCVAPPNNSCKAKGEACATGADCCLGRACTGGTCSDNACKNIGTACGGNSECCTNSCVSGSCADISPGSTVNVVGSSCTADADCASNNCQGGVCVKSFSCQPDYDSCTHISDCCNRNCRTPDGVGYVDDGVTAGQCLPLSGGCKVEGTPCVDGNSCCSKTCSDQGYGAKVCAPAGGCRIEDTPCDNASQCCTLGASPKPTTCESKPSATSATLCTVSGCNPAGMVCGKADLPDGGTVVVSARAPSSCCDGDQRTCKVDRAGIPRCFGGQTTSCPSGYTGEAGCCIAAGNQCSFSDQCCDGNPCIADSTGVLKCTPKATCQGLGTACDPANSQCCAGTVCPSGSEIPVCVTPSTSDGGTTPTCKGNGTACTTSSDCCSSICNAGVCEAPQACQPQGAACSASADCCTGFACNIPVGSTSGTCQASSCQSAGQTCSPTLGCCNGTACLDGSGANCTGSSPCTCNVILQ